MLVIIQTQKTSVKESTGSYVSHGGLLVSNWQSSDKLVGKKFVKKNFIIMTLSQVLRGEL